MRCKVGDIAVMVGGYPRAIGTLVQIEGPDPRAVGFSWLVEFLSSVWVPQDGAVCPPGTRGWCRDSILRPLRDNPGQDEMLRIVGLPQDLVTLGGKA